jgi:hypothetical protein
VTDLTERINQHITALAVAHREQLDAALARLMPGWRLCLHLADPRVVEDGPLVDGSFRMQIRHTYHYVADDDSCDEPNRTEYRLP